ncbi:MAG: hypothetical protein ACNA8W_04445 [Bradymonadaceae bacterium]
MKDSKIDSAPASGFYICWVLALIAFVIAAASGILFRMGMLDGFALGFAPHKIRHAHSHLMLMGWTTPALMLVMAIAWKKWGARSMQKSAVVTIVASWLLAMITFLPFLYWGYEKVDIGSASLPLAAILSGLCILAWYAFGVVYLIATWGVRRNAALRAWDGAIILLTISSFGAWAMGFLMIKGIDDIFWQTLMVHFFVDLFGDGWLLLGLIGLLYALNPGKETRRAHWATYVMYLGMGTVYFLGLPSRLLSDGLKVAGSAGALFIGLGLIAHLIELKPRLFAREGWIWKLLWVLLAAKAAALLIAASPAMVDWAKATGLRLVYLHLGFLGVATIGLIAAARHIWGARAFHGAAAFAGAVLLMIGALILITGLWPGIFGGRWTHWAALITSIPPTLIAAYALVRASIPAAEGDESYRAAARLSLETRP